MHDQRTCGKCGSTRTRVIAQSVSPPGDFVRCQDCGHSTLVSPTAPIMKLVGDVDKRRIERLVSGIIDASRLPCRLLAVEKANGGWRVTVRTQVGDLVTFDVPADSLAAMRAAIERALGTGAP